MEELRAKLEAESRQAELIKKSQTSLVGFLQDLKDRMLKGETTNELQKMISRKLVVH